MKVAAIDCGTNTTLLLIADVVNGAVTNVYRDEIVVTRMGQDVASSGRFHPAALLRMDECLNRYAKIIKEEMPGRVLAMATSAARDVSNAKELFAIGDKYNIPIQVIPGEMEAQITFQGATFEHEAKDGLCVIDVGGGSTEVVACRNSKITGASVNVGSVRLTEMFVTKMPTPENEVMKLLEYASDSFRKAQAQLPQPPLREVIAVAGTPTTLAAVLQNKNYSEGAVHGFRIEKKTLEQWIHRLAAMSLEERIHTTGMDTKRADVIVAGSAILLSAMNALGAVSMSVSTRGVRYGIALHAARG